MIIVGTAGGAGLLRKGVAKGVALGLGAVGLKKVLESPKLKTAIAARLQKLNSSSLKTLETALKVGKHTKKSESILLHVLKPLKNTIMEERKKLFQAGRLQEETQNARE